MAVSCLSGETPSRWCLSRKMVRRSSSVYCENVKYPLSLFIDHSWQIQWPACTSSFCWMDINVKKKNHSSSAEELLPKTFYKDVKLLTNSARHFHPLQTSELDSLHLSVTQGLQKMEKHLLKPPPQSTICFIVFLATWPPMLTRRANIHWKRTTHQALYVSLFPWVSLVSVHNSMKWVLLSFPFGDEEVKIPWD